MPQWEQTSYAQLPFTYTPRSFHPYNYTFVRYVVHDRPVVRHWWKLPWSMPVDGIKRMWLLREYPSIRVKVDYCMVVEMVPSQIIMSPRKLPPPNNLEVLVENLCREENCPSLTCPGVYDGASYLGRLPTYQ